MFWYDTGGRIALTLILLCLSLIFASMEANDCSLQEVHILIVISAILYQ
jgi:hypothetical protein